MTSGNCHKSLSELLITVFRDSLDKFEDIVENENGRAKENLGYAIEEIDVFVPALSPPPTHSICPCNALAWKTLFPYVSHHGSCNDGASFLQTKRWPSCRSPIL
jgi:hypothetical protein